MSTAAIVEPAAPEVVTEVVTLSIGADAFPITVSIGRDGKRRVHQQRDACLSVIAYNDANKRRTTLKSANKKVTELAELGLIEDPAAVIDRATAALEQIDSQINILTGIMRHSTGYTVPTGSSKVTPSDLLMTQKEMLGRAAMGARALLSTL